jgi:hypothetical protein
MKAYLRSEFETYYSVRKVSDLFFCGNVVDFNEVRVHEANLNLHMHA